MRKQVWVAREMALEPVDATAVKRHDRRVGQIVAVSGEEIDLPQAPEPEASGVIDLVAALRASLAARQAA